MSNEVRKKRSMEDVTGDDYKGDNDQVIVSMINSPKKKKQQSSLHSFFQSSSFSSATSAAKAVTSETVTNEKKKSKQKYKIYCDLDGVLCDFDAGVKKIFNGKGMEDLPSGLAWSGITRANDFYGALPWTSDGRELWNAIKHLNLDILTGVPRSRKSSRKEKAEWCARELGVETNHVDFAAPKSGHELIHGALRREKHVVNVITCWSRNKHFKSGPNRLLIDDTEKLMADWESKGGIFVLHTDTESTLARLRELEVI